ncbi:MAG: hypothetical protein HYY59_03140 [Candidatus Omnitrophica bacterium]|nr:hypothetical protein [Candidatus Omnitrophota bacterium]
MPRKRKHKLDWFKMFCLWIGLFAAISYVQLLFEWKPWIAENRLITPRSVRITIELLLNMVLLVASGFAGRILSINQRITQIENGLAGLREKLRTASKHSESFETFRSEIEERIASLEQEQERWPQMLTNTLMLAPVYVTAIVGFVYLAERVLRLLLRLPTP